MATDEHEQDRLADVETKAAMEFRRIPINEIVVEENPRKRADMAGIRRMATSIARVDLIEPVVVAPREGEGYPLVAGGRRLEALKLLGREDVPSVILSEDSPQVRRARRAAENIAREAMTGPDEAEEIAYLIRELGLAVEEAAEVLGITPGTARSRLELLDLPRDVREHLRDGALTLANGASLVKVAAGSPGLASEIGSRVASGALERKALDDDPAAVVAEIATEGAAAGPFCLPFSEGTRLQLRELATRVKADEVFLPLVEEHEEAEAEREAELEAAKKEKTTPPKFDRTRKETIDSLASAPIGDLIEVSQEDVMRARAWGGLIEYRRDRYSATGFLVCPEFALDWLFEAESRRVSVGDDDRGEAKKAPEDESLEKERARLDRERREATASNEILGRRSQLKLEYQDDVPLEQATVIASLVLDAYGRELIQGLRLTKFDWNEREVKEMRGGGVRTVERPAAPDEAREKFEELLAKSTTGAELLGRLFAAIAAAVGADQRSMPTSQRRVLALPFAPGRTDTVIGRAPAALLDVCEDLLTEKRLTGVREELGVELGGELPDRRSKRQREREAAEAAARERERAETEGPELSGSLLDELDELRRKEATAATGGADAETSEGTETAAPVSDEVLESEVLEVRAEG